MAGHIHKEHSRVVEIRREGKTPNGRGTYVKELSWGVCQCGHGPIDKRLDYTYIDWD